MKWYDRYARYDEAEDALRGTEYVVEKEGGTYAIYHKHVERPRWWQFWKRPQVTRRFVARSQYVMRDGGRRSDRREWFPAVIVEALSGCTRQALKSDGSITVYWYGCEGGGRR